ncbi:hypothetical protein QFC19_003379 [Naganishia cerealis]|uniref:Uncharacterized protein n=1 Tax=Naganishia cerealis TaxID=610337 RepID=A0ACC2W417_9TREE|nr:hypothetical protein QFC19_003379 [Naganishia cerealis]
MSEAQRRAEARRAKILARGGAGLAKLASTARGEEAAALYDTHIPSRGSTPVAPPVQNPVTADPAAEYQAELERTMAALGSSTQGTDNTGDAMKQFGEMMRKMQQDFGTSTPGSGGAIEGGLGAVDPSQDPPTPPLPAVELPDVPARRGNNNPFALAAASGPSSAPEGDMSSLFPGLNIPPEMLQMLQGGGNDGGGIGMNGPTSGNPFAPPPPAQKSPVTRLLPLIHLLSVVAFYLFTILVWEPSVWASGRQSGLGKMDSASVPVERRERWTRLRGDVGSKSDLLESGWASLV